MRETPFAEMIFYLYSNSNPNTQHAHTERREKRVIGAINHLFVVYFRFLYEIIRFLSTMQSLNNKKLSFPIINPALCSEYVQRYISWLDKGFSYLVKFASEQWTIRITIETKTWYAWFKIQKDSNAQMVKRTMNDERCGNGMIVMHVDVQCSAPFG